MELIARHLANELLMPISKNLQSGLIRYIRADIAYVILAVYAISALI